MRALFDLRIFRKRSNGLAMRCWLPKARALVMAIIETGRIEAIVGELPFGSREGFSLYGGGCYPRRRHPTLQDDCKDVTVDLDWIWEVIHLTSNDRTYRLDLDSLRKEVQTWFEIPELDRMMGPPANETDRLAREWLAQDGKRWRPFLAVCVWRALQDQAEVDYSTDLRKIAIAVECFHKASLVHDDIEDKDDLTRGSDAAPTARRSRISMSATCSWRRLPADWRMRQIPAHYRNAANRCHGT